MLGKTGSSASCFFFGKSSMLVPFIDKSGISDIIERGEERKGWEELWIGVELLRKHLKFY